MRCSWCGKKYPKKELEAVGEDHICMACKVLIEEAVRSLKRKLFIKEEK